MVISFVAFTKYNFLRFCISLSMLPPRKEEVVLKLTEGISLLKKEDAIFRKTKNFRDVSGFYTKTKRFLPMKEIVYPSKFNFGVNVTTQHSPHCSCNTLTLQ